jgi:hypothetical protein
MQLHAAHMRPPQRNSPSAFSSTHFNHILNPSPSYSSSSFISEPVSLALPTLMVSNDQSTWPISEQQPRTSPAQDPQSSQSPLGHLAILSDKVRERIYFWTIGPTFYIDQTKACKMYHQFPRFLPSICYASKTIYKESRDVLFRTHIVVRNVSTFAFISFLDSFLDDKGRWSALGYQKIESLELDSIHTIPSMYTNRSFHDQRALLLRCSNLRILEVGLYRKVLLETHKAKYRKDLRVMVEFLFFPDILYLDALVDLTIHVRDRKMDIPPTWEWDWKKQLGETEEWVCQQFKDNNKNVAVKVKPHLHNHSGEPWNYPYYEGRTDLRDENGDRMLPTLSIVKQRMALARGRDFVDPPPMPDVGRR